MVPEEPKLDFHIMYGPIDLTKYKIKKVIFNNPDTIVYWEDGSKTVVKAQKGDEWNPEKGLAMAIVKGLYGLKECDEAVSKIMKGESINE